MNTLLKRMAVVATAMVATLVVGLAPAEARRHAEGHGLRLLGMNALQARSAYQPTINQQGGRWIAYIGHHGGSAYNPQTRMEEPDGTSVVDVTNPRHPRYLTHTPGPAGTAESGGAQMARVCNGSDLPHGVAGKSYLLRPYGGQVRDGHRLPRLRRAGWRAERMTQEFDLSDPAKPVHIRDFGLIGQKPGSTGPVPTDLHGPISLGNRVYFGYGTAANGIMQIVDREKLLSGDPTPTPANLAFPQVSSLRLSSLGGPHTTLPVLGVPVPDHSDFPVGGTRDIVLIVNEATGDECTAGAPQMMYIADITDETTPQIISNYQVRESEGQYCQRGGRFGAHSSNENMTPIYYRMIVFISYFNAGVRAVDIRDPFRPREVGRYTPATTRNTDPRCIVVNGAERCTTAIQTNNVEVDDRGLIYIVDRANTGMHILKATGKVAANSGQG